MPERDRRTVYRKPRRRRFSVLLPLILILTAVLIFAIGQNRKATEGERTVETRPPSAAQDGDTITIAAAGDIVISQQILNSALQPDGSYDFSEIFLSVAPLLTDADLTVANLETNIGQVSEESAHLAPRSLLTALSSVGVDVLQTANTNSIFNGLSGLTDTIAAVEEAGMKAVGTFASAQERNASGGFTLVERNGFRVAFVAFTKGVGNLKVPEGAEYAVNLLYEDYNTTYQEVDTVGIESVLDNVKKAKPDITIALLHWGSEYDTQISSTQKEIQELMFSNGVDAILGSHSHLVQQVVTEDGCLTAYSLGSLMSSDDAKNTEHSLVLKLEFRMEGNEAVLSGWSYEPVYLAAADETGTGFRILDTNKTIDLYLSDYVERVSQTLYEALLASRAKVEELIYEVEE